MLNTKSCFISKLICLCTFAGIVLVKSNILRRTEKRIGMVKWVDVSFGQKCSYAKTIK